MVDPPRDAIDGVRLIHCDPCVAVAAIGALCVVIWRGAVTREPFQWQSAGLATTVKNHPNGAAFLCVVERTAKAPGEELRRASSKMVESHGARLKCVGVVIEGEGFLAAVNRGAVTGMALLARNPKTLVSVFAKVPDALVWAAKHVALRSPGALASAVEGIRARIPAQPPGS